jgi:hypothetical protein
MHCTENLKHLFPEMKLRGLIPSIKEEIKSIKIKNEGAEKIRIFKRNSFIKNPDR